MAMNPQSVDEENVACFSVRAALHPGAMPRVLELFAKENMTPTRWTSAVEAETVTMDIQMAGLADSRAQYLADVMRGMPLVEAVLTSAKSLCPERWDTPRSA